ncbi:MAG: hypothetical protein MR009_00620 [Sutterellaceae bacterium]|nr:hypothetical protein [Sutterellaceae bacterium]MDD7441321.1 hypothetical protein [Sutterellaceae bacterium]MDY2868066.1 hypothetical protein [Mesosutterella sp.]
MISKRQSPLIVSAADASKLPRWALLVLLATFALAGFAGHGFWSSRDEQLFGLIFSMASGSAQAWFLPTVADVHYTVAGPGIAWLGAALLKLGIPILKPVVVARIPSLVWFAAATASIWYATWHLARREEALPISLVFGEEASPRDYGRTVADSAVLLFVACFGLVARLHEISLSIVIPALFALLLLGLVWSLAHLRGGSAVAGAALGASVLCANLYWTLVLLTMTAAILFGIRAFHPFRRTRASVILLVAAAVAAVWPAGAVLSGVPFDTWLARFAEIQSKAFALPSVDSVLWIVRNFVWYLCPAWAFAAFAVYAWHRVIRRTHILLPIVSVATTIVFVICSGSTPEYTLAAAAVPTAVLAAFGTAALRTSSSRNILDWFSATIFTLAAAGLWAYFIAWTTGFPPKMAASLHRLAPNTVPWVEPLLLCCTVAVTVLWVAIVIWRLRRRPKALWRGPWLAALGITLIWVVGTALFSQMLDEDRSHMRPAREIAGKLWIFGYSRSDCVRTDGVPLSLKGMLSYSRVRIDDSGAACPFMVSRVPEGNPLPKDKIGIPTSFHRDSEVYVLRPGNAEPLSKDE